MAIEPQIEVILGLLLAISIFYSYGYDKVYEKVHTNLVQIPKKNKGKNHKPCIGNPMFKLSFLFCFGILTLLFYSFNWEYIKVLGDLCYILFIVTFLAIIHGWVKFAINPKESFNDNEKFMKELKSVKRCLGKTLPIVLCHHWKYLIGLIIISVSYIMYLLVTIF